MEGTPPPGRIVVVGAGEGRKVGAATERGWPVDVGGGREGPAGTCAGALAIVDTTRGAAEAAGGISAGSVVAAFCSSSPISAAKSANSSSILVMSRPGDLRKTRQPAPTQTGSRYLNAEV